MKKRNVLCITEIIIILVAVFCFFSTSVLTKDVSGFKGDGLVIAKTLLLILSLTHIVKFVELVVSDKDESEGAKS